MKDFHFTKNGFSFILRKLSDNCAAGFFPLYYGNFFTVQTIFYSVESTPEGRGFESALRLALLENSVSIKENIRQHSFRTISIK
jgi:hypothetical protein